MNIIKSNKELKLNDPVVTISKYVDNGVQHKGLSIRYYASREQHGDIIFTAGKFRQDGKNKYFKANEFAAIVPYSEFDPHRNIDDYLITHKTN